MTLTPIDIQQQQFGRSLRGYDRREVQSFLELVAQAMGELARENQDLRTEARRVQGELEEHRDREATLKEAMLTAQSAIDEIREQAQKEAQLAVTEAELRAEKLLFDAHRRVTKVVEDIQDLKRQRARAIEELRGVLSTHVALLEVHEDTSQSKDAQPEASVTVLDRLRPPAPPTSEEIELSRARR